MRSLSTRFVAALTVVALAALVVGLVGATDLPASDPQAPAAADPDADTQQAITASVIQLPNTTSYLEIPDERLQTRTYGQADVDVPGALAVGSEQLRVQLTVESFQQEFNASTATENRTEAVNDAVLKLEALAERAREDQRQALQSYNDGEIGTQEFVRALARADATARELLDATETVRSVGNTPLDYSIGGGFETRLTNMQPTLSILRGQLRQVFTRAITGGQRLGDPIYVETGEDDIVLATIVGNTYLRESFSGPSFDPVTRPTDRSQVRNRILGLYPWGFRVENYVSSPAINTVGNTTVYVASVTHKQGRLDVRFDANTDQVFGEIQAKRLRDVPIYDRSSQTNGSVRLTVNESHETGPMEISVTDVETDDPLNGTVYVDDIPLGTTGDDGTLWVVDRRGNSEVRVETASGSVSMFVYAT